MAPDSAPPMVAEADQLLSWARSRSPDDREHLLMKLADLCAFDPSASSATVNTLLQDVLMELLGEAERDLRRRLAERLADSAWAPHSLITVLALDEIDIARPVLASSPVLADADLVRVIVEATVEHQIEVARRPNIGARVVEAVIVRSEPAALSALAGNASAQVDDTAMGRLVDLSRRVVAMRGPLTRHPAMNGALAERMYAWVGEALRDQLSQRFNVDPERLGAEIRAALTTPKPAPPSHHLEEPDPEREEMERRLVAKLAGAGQLKPGYLLRALKDRKRGLFELALSALSGLSVQELRHAITADRADLLAYACVAVGVDKSVFATLLSGVREQNGGRPRARTDTHRRVDVAFQTRSADAARHAFRAALDPELQAAS